MTGASKILTVSYGTFSCTLEGFDDPFNTMKAIAEYFRDLAAGDRYFGAEPPVPDAAMLHRIAEREIHRRVEAKIQDNGVILRAGDAVDLAATEAPRPALQDTETTAETVAARLQRIRARHSGKAEAATASALVVSVNADQDDTYSEDQHADEPGVASTVKAPVMIDIPDQIEDILDEAENDQALAAFDDELADLPAAQPDMAFDGADAIVALDVHAETPAATLIEQDDHPQEISADEAFLANLAGDLPEDLAEDMPEDIPEDMPEAAAADGAVFSDGDFVDDLPEAYSAETDNTQDPVDLPEEFAAPEVGSEEDDDMLSRLGLVEEDNREAADPAETEADDEEDDDLTLDALDLEILRAQTEVPARIVADVGKETVPQIETEAEVAPQMQTRARARVIRIRRADAPAVAAPEQPASPGLAATTALTDEAEAALQAELAELEAEVGGLADGAKALATAEVAAEPALEPSVAEGPEVVADLATGTIRSIANQTEDESITRLLAQATSEMAGEEIRRRQSAIAHLKAAVAATEADRSLADTKNDQATDRMEPYRDDLERVVRPRRPVAESATLRPAAPGEAQSRATPLVLVSAQRIDLPRARGVAAAAELSGARVVMPVRPRRVSSAAHALSQAAHSEPAQSEPVQSEPARSEPADLGLQSVIASVAASPAAAVVMQNADQAEFDEDEILAPGEADNVFADATSFQDFADQLGASALPELLEAAAVYCAEVLQRPEFSRPLVMRQIAGLPSQTDTAREDYLRGFGTLLRQGRITKVKRGMFALTDRSPYLAEARKLAG